MKSLTIALFASLLLAACGEKKESDMEHRDDRGMQGRMGESTAAMPMGHDSGMGMHGGPMGGHTDQDMGMMNAMMMQHLGESDSLYDRRFIDMMIPHHEGAVMMAKDALTKTTRPELKALAQRIIDSQQKEIETMRAWRKAWYGSAEPEGRGEMMTRMTSMNEDMTRSLGAKDSMYEDRFIDMMIPHHQGAVMMGRDAASKARHAELKSFGEKIAGDQEKEIAQMTAWRKEWYGH